MKKVAASAAALAAATGGVLYYQNAQCQHEANRFNCVQYVRNHDGDTATFVIPGVPELFGKNIEVRFLGIDTPEIVTKDPCEKEAAKVAQVYVQDRLKNAKRIDLIHAGKDKYFRILASVLVDGEDLVQTELKMGLGYPYDGGTKEKRNYCK